jgi:hypothetical protein
MTDDFEENIIGSIESKHISDMKGIHIVSPFDQSI